jgi:hypothetical protein
MDFAAFVGALLWFIKARDICVGGFIPVRARRDQS